MKEATTRYTLRVERDLLDKMSYIAQYEGHSVNRELEGMIQERASNFEQAHGKIQTSELQEYLKIKASN